tara:strand:- start:1422 stop:1757 length:336 start_codon:yes stop_codon:yes gene_type:complete
MDERLAKALDVSKALETHQNQKNILHKQYKDNLIYYFDGHKISVDLSLINYCSNKTTPVVIIDDNKTPMLINDVTDFTKKITAIYDTASRKYLMEFKKIKSKRSVEELIDL